MAGLNKVHLIGNLGGDPEIRYSASNNAIASFNLATTERRKSRDGNWEDQTEWHKIVMFKRNAEIAEQYLRKGKQIYLEGRLQTRKWEDRNGGTRWTTEIVCQRFLMLGSGGGSQGGADSGGGNQRADTPRAAGFPNEASQGSHHGIEEQKTQNPDPFQGGSGFFQNSESKDPFLYGNADSGGDGKGSIDKAGGVEDDLPF